MDTADKERLRRRIADHLVKMEPWFTPGYKLTFIARAPHLEDGDVLVTSDEPDAVARAVERLATYEPI